MMTIRKAAVADMFYPGAASHLRADVLRHLEGAAAEPGPAPKALIVPHAGYDYSGPVAASAYARLAAHRDLYQRVVLLGPSHHVAIRGLALSGADAFRTPLGDVPLDHEAIAALEHPAVEVIEGVHRFEHSLEVQLPFLQCALGSFALVPLVVGNTPPTVVASVLAELWGGPETLVVVSSDLSHYLDYADAVDCDRMTCAAIERLHAGGIADDGACGAAPLRGLLLEAKRRGMLVNTLDLRNSGDTAGGTGQVVGYGAWAFTEPAGA